MLMLGLMYGLLCAFIAIGHWSGAYRRGTWLIALIAWQLAMQLVAGAVAGGETGEFIVAIVSVASYITIRSVMGRYGLVYQPETEDS